jgi:hypothetical protein
MYMPSVKLDASPYARLHNLDSVKFVCSPSIAHDIGIALILVHIKARKIKIAGDP